MSLSFAHSVLNFLLFFQTSTIQPNQPLGVSDTLCSSTSSQALRLALYRRQWSFYRSGVYQVLHRHLVKTHNNAPNHRTETVIGQVHLSLTRPHLEIAPNLGLLLVLLLLTLQTSDRQSTQPICRQYGLPPFCTSRHCASTLDSILCRNTIAKGGLQIFTSGKMLLDELFPPPPPFLQILGRGITRLGSSSHR